MWFSCISILEMVNAQRVTIKTVMDAYVKLLSMKTKKLLSAHLISHLYLDWYPAVAFTILFYLHHLLLEISPKNMF